MILWIVVERLCNYDSRGGDYRIKRRLEELSGEPCLVLHMSQATPKLLRETKPTAILISGCSTWFREFDIEEFYPLEDLIHECTDIPTIGFCGSHQLFGFIYNQGFRNMERVYDEQMRPLRDREPQIGWWVNANTAGWYTELGYYPIQLVQGDPLFDGLPNPCVMPESHTCEIKRLPDDFDLLASTENCRVQAMKHRDRLLYGTQFHPEQWIDEYPHGKRLLQNFFSIAGLDVPKDE